MIYLVYLVLVPISLLLTLIAVVFAPLMAIFKTEQEGWLDNQASWGLGPRLVKVLSWFQTPDNSLDGDATFQRLNPPSYCSHVKWLWRNPAYAFALRYLNKPFNATYQGDPTIKDNDNAKAGWCLVHANGLFQFRWVQPIGYQRCIYVNLGWNIMALVDPNTNPRDPYQATFVFSPRISGYR